MFLLAVSLILSVILLLLANNAFRGSRHPAVVIAISTVVLLLLPILVMTTSYVVLYQGAILFVAVFFVPRNQPRRFAVVSIACTVLAFGVAGALAYVEYRDIQNRFPVESLETRLPRRSLSTPARSVSLADPMDDDDRLSFSHYAPVLERLHENATEIFLTRAGFGVSRMYMSYDGAFRENQPADPKPSPASAWTPSLSAAAPVEVMTAVAGSGEYGELHKDVLPGFFRDGYGFGYFRDRSHVVGFRPHGFRPAQEHWGPRVPSRVDKVLLVGLVVHPEPVVYLTEELPTMAKLDSIPMRPLDAFETAGLAAISHGDTLFVRKTARGLRMLGAIRASKTCTECHGCERGQLLGAFSYSLADHRP